MKLFSSEVRHLCFQNYVSLLNVWGQGDFLNKIYQGCIKLINSDTKDIYNVRKDMLFFSTFCSFKNPEKMIKRFSTFYKNQCFLSIKSSY